MPKSRMSRETFERVGVIARPAYEPAKEVQVPEQKLCECRDEKLLAAVKAKVRKIGDENPRFAKRCGEDHLFVEVEVSTGTHNTEKIRFTGKAAEFQALLPPQIAAPPSRPIARAMHA